MQIRLLNCIRLRPFLLLLGTISLISGLVYRFYALDRAGVALSLAITALFFIILWYFGQKFNLGLQGLFLAETDVSRPSAPRFVALAAAYFLFWLAASLVLLRSGTIASIVSPWQAVPLWVLGLYFVGCAILLAYFSKGGRWRPALLSLHYILSFSVIIFVYRLGYGYDFFIHQATLELIDKAGFVLPKADYYLGQYGLVMVLHRLSQLPVYWLHLLLVPCLSALLLPPVLLRWIEKMELESDHYSLVLMLLALPYGFLAFTTPQNLGYLFLIVVVALTWKPDRSDLLIAGMLSLAALVTQPIAGLPAVLLTIWRITQLPGVKNARMLRGALIMAATIGLPLAFAALEKLDLKAMRFAWPDWLPSTLPSLPSQELIGWNALYFFGHNWYWIVLSLVIAGFAWRKQTSSFAQEQQAATALAAGFLLAHWLTKLLPFGYLIGYERNDYAARLLFVALILALPLIIVAFDRLLAGIASAGAGVRLPWFAFLAFCLTASFYLSYPRLDRYANSRGYSVGRYDVEAAEWIDKDADKPYVVLANQQVSAAALKRFGFAHYYNGLFYYPVPTASPLYQSYLKMVYEHPDEETAREAAELAGVRTVYFVLNKYWHAFPKVKDEAEFAADGWHRLGDNEVLIFKYEL